MSLVRRDRTRPVVSGGLLEVTERWVLRPVIHYAASDRNLTIEIGRSVFEDRDDVAAIR